MIIGNKVVIRQYELGDEKYLYKWWNNGSMMEHATFPYGLMNSEESIRQNVQKELQKNELFPEGKRFILCRKEDMKPIGEMNYGGWNKRNRISEFGIKICEVDEQGKGYGEDALAHFIDYMFRNLNLIKVELTTMADNKRAQNFYKKLGFKEIGIIRKGCYDSRRGENSDVMYMDLLREEWEESKKGFKLNYFENNLWI